jgi:selenophosphate synthase
MLLVYAPASEYILAIKITVGRQKDLDDCAILLPKTKIRTRKQAQQLLDQYILPGGQQKNAESIENALNRLFGREG